MAAYPLDDAFLDAVATRIREQIDQQATPLHEIDPHMVDLVSAITGLMSSGKRLRAAFLYYGHLAAGGQETNATVTAATAMEFFQAAALLHDDVMDDSDTRRGAPTAHRAMANQHLTQRWDGSADSFGRAGAILAGDLCLVWSDIAFARSGWSEEALARARPTFDLMRTQLMGGQYLDMLNAARPWRDDDTATRNDRVSQVMRYKSGKYSVEHPLLIGADAAGVSPEVRHGLSAFGVALGEAFQLRDDILGVFGDPGTTGKPSGDDLREGKRTALVVATLASAPPADADRFTALLGDPRLSSEDVTWMRDLLTTTEAIARVEERITELRTQALAALDGLAGHLAPQ